MLKIYSIIIFYLSDIPTFGETVHEPPTLTLPRRSKVDKSKVKILFLNFYYIFIISIFKAGTKDLLLKEKINQWNK